VYIIVGATLSGTSTAISVRAQAQKVLMITPSGTAAAVTNAGDYVFRTCFIDPFQGVVGADFAYDTLKVTKAAVLYDEGGDYQTGLGQAFKTEFTKKGGTIVADEAYADGSVDFSAQVTKNKAANPQVVYLPNYYNDIALQAKQLRAQGVTCPLVGGDGWDSLIDNCGDEIMPGYWASAFAADSTDPLAMQFSKDFTAKYNAPATQFAALAYDSMMLLRDAMNKAQSVDPTAVRDALLATNGNYVTGHIKFDQTTRNPIKSANILEIVKGADGKLANKYMTMVTPQ
jgi:branched-chain amino acid transport system substrate-binding protein